MPDNLDAFLRENASSPSPLWRVQVSINDLPALARLHPAGTGVARKVMGASTASRKMLEEYYYKTFTFTALYESRWCDGSFPAWYGADTPITAAHEILHHAVMRRVDDGGKPALLNWKERRGLISSTCNAVLINLVKLVSRHKWLVCDNYSKCQKLGKYIYERDLHGILYQSARSVGKCAAIFRREKLSEPIFYGDIYLSCDGNNFYVCDSDGTVVVSKPVPPDLKIFS